MPSRRLLAILGLCLATTSCGEAPGPTTFTPYEPMAGTPERIAYDQGLTRYLGATPPSAVVPGAIEGVTTFEFDPADGPMCMRGGHGCSSSWQWGGSIPSASSP